MSHFSCLVVGDDVEGQLAPYHQFECTGRDDQYVQTIDITEEVRAEYLRDTVTKLRLADGTTTEPYGPECYRDPTPEEEEAKGGRLVGSGAGDGLRWESRDWGDGRGHRAKVYELPPGAEEVEVPARLVQGFAEFVADQHGYKPVPFGEEPDLGQAHKYGYYTLKADGTVDKVVDRTNPRGGVWRWLDAEGATLGDTVGDEVLSAVQRDIAAGRVQQGNEEQGRSIYVLSSVSEGAERGAHVRTAATLVSETPVRDDRSAVPGNVDGAGRPLSDMQHADAPDEGATADADDSARRPLSRNRVRSRNTVLDVQPDAGAVSGSHRHPDPRAGVSYPVAKVLVGGAKWDWWVVGGRWGGYFKLKPEFVEQYTRAGLMPERRWSSPEDMQPGWVDRALKGHIDLEGMRAAHVAEQLAEYRKFHEIVAGRPFRPWPEVRDACAPDFDRARKVYHEQEAVKALKESRAFGYFADYEDFLMPEDAYVRRARDNAISTFAVVRDGAWFEKGAMGWWGIVRDEQDQQEWDAKFNEMLDSLPDETTLTVVDCHI